MAYVTPDDFFRLYGRNLNELLRNDSNDSTQSERFIEMVTIHLKNWIDANTFRRLDYDHLTPYQNQQWKYAILSQCYYTYKEGAKALGLSSGVDDEKGVILDYGTIRELEVCPAALDFLSNAGLFNLVVKNRPRRWMGGVDIYEGYDGRGGYYPPSPEPVPPGPEPEPTPDYSKLLKIAYTDNFTGTVYDKIAYMEV